MKDLTTAEKRVVTRAMNILERSVNYTYDSPLTTDDMAKKFCRLRIGAEEVEKFLVVFLNTQHHVIASEIMFTGTIDSAAVYPREVARRALELNAAAVILSHNHPSGIATPSEADIRITQKITEALATLSMSMLDHIVVSAHDAYSMRSHGHVFIA